MTFYVQETILTSYDTSLYFYTLVTGIEQGKLVNSHNNMLNAGGKNTTTLRILNYPPVPDDTAPGAVRCGEHSDYGSITLLLQDTMGGLEVKIK